MSIHTFGTIITLSLKTTMGFYNNILQAESTDILTLLLKETYIPFWALNCSEHS